MTWQCQSCLCIATGCVSLFGAGKRLGVSFSGWGKGAGGEQRQAEISPFPEAAPSEPAGSKKTAVAKQHQLANEKVEKVSEQGCKMRNTMSHYFYKVFDEKNNGKRAIFGSIQAQPGLRPRRRKTASNSVIHRWIPGFVSPFFLVFAPFFAPKFAQF